MLKKVSIILFVILLMLGLSGHVNAETEFALDKDSIEVRLNGTNYISFTGGSGTVTWTSQDPSIATVDNGNVRGLKIGETVITATRGGKTDTCTVKVVYESVQIGGNERNNVAQVNLVLNYHDTETLVATVSDGELKKVDNAVVNWKSSDNSIVTIDASSGKMNAVKSGTATITAEASGVSDTCQVTVFDAPNFTDFKNATYDTTLVDNSENLKISGVTPNDTIDHRYYYIITPNNEKPELTLKYRNN